MNTAILIPARLASTRFPEKMLQALNGKALIKHVYDICRNTGFDTIVLTDSKKIASIIPEAVITESADNGTERCSWFAKNTINNYQNFVNVQGDMPDVTEDIINAVANNLKKYEVSTAYTPMSEEERSNPHNVKVIHNGKTARWFGRGFTGYGDWHLGVYGYTRQSLLDYMNLRVYNEEHVEKLEQLRWLQNNYEIGVTQVEFNGLEINTPEDLKEWHNRNSH